MARNKIKQPKIEEEKELNDLAENRKDYVKVRGRRYKIGFILPGTRRKLTRIVLEEGDDSKVACKCAAVLALNGLFMIKFWYWLVWRWFYYVKQYTDGELAELLALGKKKAAVEDYYVCTILLTEMKDTLMAMTREEVRRIRQGSSSAQPGA